MPRARLSLVALLVSVTLAGTARVHAQESGVHWQQDIEAAKAAARQSNRLVLVHVWANGCAPCAAMEQNVFNQPGMGGAIESKFVPVKLNADENPGTAQFYGITRVPTDLILTSDGQLIGKMISPATPGAYIGELMQIANQRTDESGGGFQTAVAAAQQPRIPNSAYASLPIGQGVPPAVAPTAPIVTATPPTAASGTDANNNVFSRVANKFWPDNSAPPTNNFASTASAMPATTIPATVAPTEPSRFANSYTPITAPSTIAPATSKGPVDPFTMASMPTVPTSAGAPSVPLATTVPSAIQQPPPAVTTNSYATTATAGAVDPIAASGPTTRPDVRQLPAGAPPLGFDGYCPVSMRTKWRWVAGDPKFGAIHRGRTYWFSGPQEQQQFLANPDFFSPALAGVDPVLAIDHRQAVPGTREHSLDYDNQFFMFSSEATLQQFTANPERYASGVRQAMGMHAGQQVR